MRAIIWLMGPPGSGKTTLARAVQRELAALVTVELGNNKVVILDADHLRRGPMLDLGYNDRDRQENITRLAIFAVELEKRNVLPIVAAVTPTRQLQEIARDCSPFLVYLSGRCRPLWEGTTFEAPMDADLSLNTGAMPVGPACNAIIKNFNRAIQ